MPVSLTTRLAAGALAVGTLACAAALYRSDIEQAGQNALQTFRNCFVTPQGFRDCAVALTSRACYVVEAALPYVRQAGEAIVEYAPIIASHVKDAVVEYTPKIIQGAQSLYENGPDQLRAFFTAAKPVAAGTALFLCTLAAAKATKKGINSVKSWMLSRKLASEGINQLFRIDLPPEIAALLGGRQVFLHFPQDDQGPWGLEQAGQELIMWRGAELVEQVVRHPELYEGQQSIILTIERPRAARIANPANFEVIPVARPKRRPLSVL